MSCLRYLLVTRFKNSLLELRKRPGRAILYLVLAVLLGFSVFASSEQTRVVAYRDINELFAMVFVLYAGFFLMNASRGLDTGATFYAMSDVHFLFPAPVSPKLLLFYGIFRQLGLSLVTSLFLVFQYGWINSTYGLDFSGMALIVAGFVLCVFFAQLTAMVLYLLTGGNEKLQKAVSTAAVVICALYMAYLLFPVFTGGELLVDGVGQASTPVAGSFPVAGWIAFAVRGILLGNGGQAALWMLLLALCVVALLGIVFNHQSDYYEDVLLATEVSHSTAAARKEGAAEIAPRKVKTGKTGLGKGFGASAFFYKQVLESRRSGILMMDRTTLIFAAFVVVWTYALSRDEGILTAFFLSTYLQMIMINKGRWSRELSLPYVFLIPQTSFRKLLQLVRFAVLQSAVEAPVIFIPVGLLLRSTPMEVAGCILGRIGFALLYIAGSVMIRRQMGGTAGNTLAMLVYMLLMAVLSVPAIVMVVIFSGISLPVGLAGSFVVNLAVAAALLFFSRTMLDDIEVANS